MIDHEIHILWCSDDPEKLKKEYLADRPALNEFIDVDDFFSDCCSSF